MTARTTERAGGADGAPVRFTLNGEPREAPPGASVADVVAALLGTGAEAPTGVAVAVGDEVVPRGAWAQRVVAGGERVEVLGAVAGG